ncbi:MAG TPA: LytTR family DNA-binding domain-containing protein [Gammaproteobacteria bacterium]|nr:LytTR family DNA-binding domain-containing protein [Gammaproteobacteria bacterium]HPI95251.1 LytTR family DNA-binding domain-containing protein [Gammaproteobacteria bacterium]HPQ87326.1 LytTR family DNA-binding domain-containing protein [Gammaproteobacteria bacterium]
MKFLVVDDEPLAIARLQKLLQEAGINDIVTANNGQNAADMAEKHHPAVILLDVEMPVMNGLEAAEAINKISPESKIIFCTAYDDFALKAFDLAASDYLLKPVSRERLSQALNKVSAKDFVTTFSFVQGTDLISLPLDDIYCFISEDKATYMHCQRGVVVIDDSLLSLEKKFPHLLLRISRKALINRKELFGIHRTRSAAFAKLQSIDLQPQISRRNLAAIKEILRNDK